MLAALPWNTNAQSTHDTTWLDTITVVGTRTETSIQNNPASVSVIDQEEIARRAPESIAEMLRDVPGVEVVDSSAAGMKRIRIRGESSRRVTILVDGQEITDHSTYGTPLLVDPSGVERIEVVRGPASVLYGAKAIGGVVNIITKRGAAQPIQLELGGSYYSGTRGTQGWAAVSGTLDDFDYRISGETDHHEDRKVPVGRYTSTGRLDGSSYHNDNLALHLGYAFGENRNHYLSLKADRHELSTDSWTDPDTLTYPITDFRIELPKRERRKVGLFYDGSDLGSVVRKVHADMYYQVIDRLFSNHVTMQPMPVVKVGVTSTSDDQNTNYGGTAQVDLQFHPDHYTIAGIHYLMDDLDTHKTSTTVSQVFGRPTTTITHNQDRASIRTTSAFLQDEWTLTPDVKLTAGLRYYNVQTKLKSTSSPERAGYGAETTSRTVKSLGLTYTGLPSTTLRALYSEGYIMPTLLQLFTDTTAGRGAVTLGNPGLKPETSRNIEIGTRYNADGLMLDGAVFFARAKNYITSNVSCSAAGAGCPDRATVSDYIYKNMDKADTRGLELAAEYQLPGTSFTPYLSGTWIKRELHEPSLNTYNSGTPTLSGRLGVRYEGRLVGKDVWGDVFVRAATDQKLTTGTDAAPDTTRLPGWGTLNVAFGGSLGQNDSLRYGVHFNNVLDKEYRASLDELPGTGRSVELTMRLTF
ncbi:MAG: TonB-dependent receptor [Corticimicrobacter sp.]|uniref:TonB-dependent receptor plug domain-containing protein n=1 Tax=Corticimicrobacter sp. TaxID=2678536 RepID=UPI0032DB98FD